jgi:hypothetical protein
MRNQSFIINVTASFLEQQPAILFEASALHEVCHVMNDDLSGVPPQRRKHRSRRRTLRAGGRRRVPLRAIPAGVCGLQALGQGDVRVVSPKGEGRGARSSAQRERRGRPTRDAIFQTARCRKGTRPCLQRRVTRCDAAGREGRRRA